MPERSFGGQTSFLERPPPWMNPGASATPSGPALDVMKVGGTHPALICQGACGQVHGRCLGRPQGVCTLPQGHARPHKCSHCNQLYM